MTAALVTTYNEADTIGPLVAHLREYVDEVVVVDDAKSTDGTGKIAGGFGAQVLSKHSGFAQCLAAGFLWLNGEQVVVIDAGGAHDPAAIPDLLDLSADVAIGSRFCPEGDYLRDEGAPAWREYASRAYARACSIKTGYRIYDWTSGYRAYSPEAVKVINGTVFQARRHAWQVEALAACLRAGLCVDETPITYRLGRSSFNRDAALEALAVLWELKC